MTAPTTPMTWPGCGAKFVRDDSADDEAMTTMTEQEQIRVLRKALEDIAAAHGQSNSWIATEALAATATIQPVAVPEPVPSTELIQWRNIQKVVNELAKFCFGDGAQCGQISLGDAYTSLVNSLTAKDGLSVQLEPLCRPVMRHSASAPELPEPRIVELYRESFKTMVGRLREPPQHVSPSVLDFARAIEAEVASRFRAQGGNTSPESNLAAPAQATPDAQYKAQRDRLLDFIKNAQVSSGVCMCGSSVEGHGFGDGHSPVDVWDYSVMKLIEEIEAQDATTTTQAATPADSQKGEGDA